MHTSPKKKETFVMKKIMVSFVVLISVFLLASCGTSPSAPAVVPTHHPAATTAPGTPTTQPASPVPFKVVSIEMRVSPSSLAGMSCNSSVTFTYTVTFHVAPNSHGGTIQFMYTTNNGRSSTKSSVTASAGTTTMTYTFTSSGVLSPDHTFPGIAEVITTSPNQVNSLQVKPAGRCS